LSCIPTIPTDCDGGPIQTLPLAFTQTARVTARVARDAYETCSYPTLLLRPSLSSSWSDYITATATWATSSEPRSTNRTTFWSLTALDTLNKTRACGILGFGLHAGAPTANAVLRTERRVPDLRWCALLYHSSMLSPLCFRSHHGMLKLMKSCYAKSTLDPCARRATLLAILFEQTRIIRKDSFLHTYKQILS
jgi:hypothetical protein